MLNLALTDNEPRARHLFDALKEKSNVLLEFDFDQIDPATKYLAAALSFKTPRSEWWGNYQMHPLIQRKRRINLQQELSSHKQRIDALVMWGSWFHPFKGLSTHIPYYLYIDQSRSLSPTKDEPKTSTYGRKKSYQLQVETYKNCSGIFCMSEWAKQQTLEAHSYLQQDKIHVLGWGPCGIDLTKERPNYKVKKKIVLHVSNDFKRKGVDFLIEVAQRVFLERQDIHFIVVGQDDEFHPDQVPPNVEFTGKILNKSELEEYFRQASVFFLPHRFDRNPHVLVEAMGAGIPLVTSRQGGAIELIDQEGTGILCSIGDIEAYKSSIYKLMDSRDLLQSMGTSGYQKSIEFYNWRSIADRMIALIR